MARKGYTTLTIKDNLVEKLDKLVDPQVSNRRKRSRVLSNALEKLQEMMEFFATHKSQNSDLYIFRFCITEEWLINGVSVRSTLFMEQALLRSGELIPLSELGTTQHVLLQTSQEYRGL